MAGTPPKTAAAVPAGSRNLFFVRERCERATESVARRVRQHAVADYSWFPDLVEIGGFYYEAGERGFDGWATSLKSRLGDCIEPLLREAWDCIPRAAAEKFAALVNGVLSERERMRVEQAYRQLRFPIAGVSPEVLMTQSSDGESLSQDGASIHQHTCCNCGMPFRHEAWECEPPSDRFCNLCAEEAMGPVPVWIQRWNFAEESPSGASGAAAAAPAMAQPVATPTAAQTSTPKTAAVATPDERGLDKVAGMNDLKELLYDEVVSALREPDDLKAYGLTIPNGILLFGPPGCGKTYIARQLAEELNYFFKEVFPSEIGSTFIHDTTLKIREVFDTAADHAPALLFVDEFEAMVPARRSLGAHQHHTSEEVSEFLKQLEACAQRRIVLIAATNEPWKIDPAVLRTGRLDKLIYVQAPDAKSRSAMLYFHLYGRLQCPGIDVVSFAQSLPGYSASDIKLLVDEAARRARKSRQPISAEHLHTAARELVPPSVTAREELRFLAFAQRGIKTSRYLVANDVATVLRTVKAGSGPQRVKLARD